MAASPIAIPIPIATTGAVDPPDAPWGVGIPVSAARAGPEAAIAAARIPTAATAIQKRTLDTIDSLPRRGRREWNAPGAEEKGEVMAVYVTLIRWTDQGRTKTKDLPARYEDGQGRIKSAGGKEIGTWVTMGQYDMISVVEAPNDEAMATIALQIAGRGNAITETLRAFTMGEVKKLV